MKDFNNVVNSINKDFIFISGIYKNYQSVFRVKHLLCGNEFEITYKNYKRRQSCPDCLPNKKMTLDLFKKRIFKKFGNEYTIIGNSYINNRTPILVCHNKCGTEWDIRPDNLLLGYGCNSCGGSKPLNTDIFKQKVFNVVGDEYKVTGDYKNIQTKISMFHNICNTEWSVKPANFLHNGTRCPNCRTISDGVSSIIKWLDDNNIMYTTEYSFSDCIDIRPLRFDFAITINDTLLLIEYDGKQHFKTGGFYTKDYLKDRIKKDEIKNNYCLKEDIPLLRINYKDINTINYILNDFITNNVQRLSESND